MWKSILLGIVQGLTEFLPVSSSGHLTIFQELLGIELESSLPYDLVLHIATTFAILFFFSNDITQILSGWFRAAKDKKLRQDAPWRLGCGVIIGTGLTGIIGVSMKQLVEAFSQDVIAVGVFLCITGVVLLATKFAKDRGGKIGYTNSLFIGIVQGLATLPGISRSGSTIATALFFGVNKEEAFKFSFLLSIPAICGASILEYFNLGTDGFLTALPVGWYFGAIVAFLIGYLSLVLLKRLVIEAKWHYFGIYCLIVGVVAICY